MHAVAEVAANVKPSATWPTSTRAYMCSLAADGAFGAEGTFIALAPVPEALLAEGFRRAVLECLSANEVLLRRGNRRRNWAVAGRHVSCAARACAGSAPERPHRPDAAKAPGSNLA
ncbi:MAG: hypothetical protein HY848_21940 [Betaproteobacteria bacterium]|nr:hypothetical protein [Betaproteobacteria bacterium]